jgi:hypothetical protein
MWLADPEAEPGLPIEWYQSELRACRKRIADLEDALRHALAGGQVDEDRLGL